MDEVTWAALTAALTALGAAWTWYAFRHRGVASGLRGAGLTLLPPAAWLTGTMEMFTRIGGAVSSWATGLVLSPLVWAGIVLAGLSVVLLGTSSALRSRARGVTSDDRPKRGLPASSQGKGEPALGDDDLGDVEDILKRHGIT
ncbi:hypothetical protein GCM10009623_00270 [Nocardioides aestuarii]|uniref:Cellulose synthase n=1 Tax=Nocardioides aestuarii TaxID=252231 RepID=A0ABW4TJC9_9ACTN